MRVDFFVVTGGTKAWTDTDTDTDTNDGRNSVTQKAIEYNPARSTFTTRFVDALLFPFAAMVIIFPFRAFSAFRAFREFKVQGYFINCFNTILLKCSRNGMWC